MQLCLRYFDPSLIADEMELMNVYRASKGTSGHPDYEVARIVAGKDNTLSLSITKASQAEVLERFTITDFW